MGRGRHKSEDGSDSDCQSALVSLLQQLRSKSKSSRPTSSSQEQRRLETELESLKGLQKEQQRANGRLRGRLLYMECGMLLLDKEQAAQLQSGLTRSVPSTVTFASPLTAAGSQRQGGMVSVWALPDPEHWDSAFEDRVRGLSTLDMVLLHRQYLHELALLVPKSQQYGPKSTEQPRLQLLMNKYSYFNSQACTLAAEAWAQRSQYCLETLQLMEPPSEDYFKGLFGQGCRRESLKTHLQDCAAMLRKLRLEYQSLKDRHKGLTAHAHVGGNTHVPSNAHAAGGSQGWAVKSESRPGPGQHMGWASSQGHQVSSPGLLGGSGARLYPGSGFGPGLTRNPCLGFEPGFGPGLVPGCRGGYSGGQPGQAGTSSQVGLGPGSGLGLHLSGGPVLGRHLSAGQGSGLCSSHGGQSGPGSFPGLSEQHGWAGMPGTCCQDLARGHGNGQFGQGSLPRSSEQQGWGGMPGTRNQDLATGNGNGGLTQPPVGFGPGWGDMGRQLGQRFGQQGTWGGPCSSNVYASSSICSGSGTSSLTAGTVGDPGGWHGTPGAGASSGWSYEASSGCNGATAAVCGPPDASASGAMRDLVTRMEANLWRQQLALKHCLYALWQSMRGEDCTDVAKVCLVMYPRALGVADFVQFMLDHGPGDAAPSCLPKGGCATLG